MYGPALRPVLENIGERIVIMNNTHPDHPPSGPGMELIAAERKRQLDEKGYTAAHDDQHANGELSLVAALLASPELLYRKDPGNGASSYSDPWPETWDRRWDKRPYHDKTGRPNHDVNFGTEDRIRQLEKAGALIAAEIDRLLRIQARVTASEVTEKTAVDL
jgi:hypothetical protein